MMKKLIVMVALTAMVMGLACGAQAYMFKTVVNTTAGGTINTLTLGDPGAGANGTWTQPAGTTWLAAVAPTGNVDGGAWLVTSYIRPTAPNTWNFAIFAGSTYSGNAKIEFFCSNLGGATATGSSANNGKKWVLKQGNTEIFNNFVTATGSSTSNLATYTFAPGSISSPTWFTLSQVPEPGSMVAMASGLVGLLGFGIRRRK